MDAEQYMAEGSRARANGQQEQAQVAFSQAVKLMRMGNDPAKLAGALTSLARIERNLGRLDAALECLSETVAICRKTADPERLAWTLRHQGDVLMELGNVHEATGVYAEAQAFYNAAGTSDPLDRANAIRSFAVHAEAIGDLTHARRLWVQARQLYAQLDETFVRMTGVQTNPGVEEADFQLSRLQGLA